MRRINPDRPLTQSERNKRHYEKHKDRELQRNRKYHQDNKDEIRQRHRNNRHKMTQEEFDSLLSKQENRCACCHKVFTGTPRIDHNHECCKGNRSCSKCRRALLCNSCNVLIGMCFESVEILSNAIQYLKEHKKCQ